MPEGKGRPFNRQQRQTLKEAKRLEKQADTRDRLHGYETDKSKEQRIKAGLERTTITQRVDRKFRDRVSGDTDPKAETQHWSEHYVRIHKGRKANAIRTLDD